MRALAAALCVLVTALPLAAQQHQLVDRILAVVDEDPILASEVEQVIVLGLVERREDESEEALRRRVLEQLIEQRLRFHEIDRFGFTEIPIEEVERHYRLFRERFASDAEYRARLAELGLDEKTLRRLVARQVMVLTYVDERLGPRVFVGLEEIRAYYDDVLVPRLRAAGEPVPPIQDLREQIRGVLKQQRLNEEIALWTEELRQSAEIDNYVDDAHAEPPAHEVGD